MYMYMYMFMYMYGVYMYVLIYTSCPPVFLFMPRFVV